MSNPAVLPVRTDFTSLVNKTLPFFLFLRIFTTSPGGYIARGNRRKQQRERKAMNILLVHLNPLIRTYQLGLAYIASSLRKRGHDVTFLSLTGPEKKAIVRKLDDTTDMVFISVTSDSFELCRKTVAIITARTRGKVPILLGGIHPTVCPEACIGLEGVTGICIGEGEDAACELADRMSEGNGYTEIMNLWIKKDGVIHKNELRPLIDPLDRLPFPDYGLFRNYVDFRILPVIVSRGCSYRCFYCCNNTLHSLYRKKGRYLRYHSVEYGIAMIRSILAEFSEFEVVEFYDDTLTLNKPWLHRFMNEFSRLNIKFVCNSRFDTIDEETIRLLADSGCVKLNMAVESGSPEIRKKVLGRDISNEEIIDIAHLLKKYRIDLHTHNMVGVPYETEKDILETVELNRRIKPETTVVSIFNPYPKTVLGEMCEKENWIDRNLKTTSYFDFSVLRTPAISPGLVNYYFLIFPHLVYDSGLQLTIKKALFWILHLRRNFLYRLLRNVLLKKTSPVIYNTVRRMMGNL